MARMAPSREVASNDPAPSRVQGVLTLLCRAAAAMRDRHHLLRSARARPCSRETRTRMRGSRGLVAPIALAVALFDRLMARPARALRLVVGARRRLPDLHHPVLHVEDDGLLQDGVPLEIEEAAWVDGCSRGGGIWHVIVPVSRPGLMITAMFAFSLSMQEALYAVVYVGSRTEQVVTVGIATVLIRGDIYYWGSLM